MKAEWTNKDSLTSGETTKAILVIGEMPTECEECPLYEYTIYNEKCKPLWRTLEKKEKPRWCPLKPIPMKLEFFRSMERDNIEDAYCQGHTEGWNGCLEEILDE